MIEFKHMKEQFKPEDSVTEELTEKIKKENKHSPAKWIGIAAAFLVSVLVATNFIQPAFAEKIPLIGNIFIAINRRTEKYEVPYVTFKTAEMSQGMNLSASNNDPIHLILSGTYCDGMRMGFSLSADVPEGWENVEYANLNIKSCKINGTDCMQFDILPRFVREEDKLIGTGSINLYNTFDISKLSGYATVDITFETFKPADDGSNKFTYDVEESMAVRGEWSYKFEVKCNTDEIISIKPNTVSNGWKFDSVLSGPSETVITVTSPENFDSTKDIRLANLKDKNGNPIEWFCGYTTVNEDGSVTYTFSSREIEDANGIRFEIAETNGSDFNILAKFK